LRGEGKRQRKFNFVERCPHRKILTQSLHTNHFQLHGQMSLSLPEQFHQLRGYSPIFASGADTRPPAFTPLQK
jgi:hypothetical protein